MKALEKTKLLSNVVTVGDVHGKFGELGFRIKERYKVTDSVIFVAGDIGMGFHAYGYYTDEWKKLNNIARKTNNVIVGVRGNHDDPFYFDGNFQMSNVVLVPDYTVVETANHRVLLIGGGISIDRKTRKEGKSYWIDEKPVYDEDKLKLAGKCDILVSHTSPSFVGMTDKLGLLDWARHDTSLLEDCSYERMVFTKVWDYLDSQNMLPAHWTYGHFHMSKTEYVKDTKFRAMDELEFYNLFS